MIRAVAVVLAGRLTLRVYRGADLIVEAPLSRRGGLLLASDLLNALLMPEIAAAENAPVLDQAIQSRVTDHQGHAREYGQ